MRLRESSRESSARPSSGDCSPPALPCRVCELLSHNGRGTFSALLVASAQHLLSPEDTAEHDRNPGAQPDPA